MRTIEELAAEEHEIACYQAEHWKAAYKLYREEMTAEISLARLEEICNAEREGRCFTPPCKVGDTVYVAEEGVVTQMTVGNIYPYGLIIKGHLCNLYLTTDYTYACKTVYDIGKTVFLTRAEAEAALTTEANK